jgi:arylsulfatase A-like enzyme
MFNVREPGYRRAWEITNLTEQWLDRHGNRPFFLFVNYMDAHDPHMPPPEEDQRFARRPPGEEWVGFPKERYAASLRGAENFSAEEIAFLIAQYDAELISLDRELGRLMKYLNGTGFFENTILFLTTDHGEAFWEHGFPQHGNAVYQHEIDGFLVVKTPQSLAPVKASPLMQLVDIYPTVMSLLDQPIPDLVQGSPWGQGRDYTLSEVFCRSCGSEVGSSYEWPDALRHEQVAVMIGHYKLIRSTRGPDEIYDLSTDPAESSPLATADPRFLRRAEEIIAERNKRMVQGLSTRPKDKNLLEKLRSLGYVQ